MKTHLQIPKRRYAIFTDILRGDYAIVVPEKDLANAPKWGGFKAWLGGVKPAQTRFVEPTRKWFVNPT